MECMNCGSTSDTTDFLYNGERVILCVDCRYDQATGKLTLPLKTMGRPSLGITKKVSLTMPEKLWEHLDVQAKNSRSEYLRSLVDWDRSTAGQWGNEACLGYVMLAAERIGYSPQQLDLLIQAIQHEFDVTTVHEARKAYERN
ncbi:hypothetical protein Q0V21_30535 [Paenibacillus sp. 11B]|uniref:hypothetical protein n=1 Tax=Paenibacillus sp. 11B TaxID=3060965 RepID=UPI002650E594|nr:hypothetical protein [Paenibacillus sp. 11B]MDN8593068.1 hypothetical protein [Paenibacillus sp. 11B]